MFVLINIFDMIFAYCILENKKSKEKELPYAWEQTYLSDSAGNHISLNIIAANCG